jgi:hypothetical protein
MTTNSSIQACHSQAGHAQPNDAEEDDIIIFTERPGRLEKAVYAIRSFKDHNIGLLLIMASEVTIYSNFNSLPIYIQLHRHFSLS